MKSRQVAVSVNSASRASGVPASSACSKLRSHSAATSWATSAVSSRVGAVWVFTLLLLFLRKPGGSLDCDRVHRRADGAGHVQRGSDELELEDAVLGAVGGELAE